MTGAIDLAFVDRADIKQYIGLPSSEAVYKIYMSCIDELVKCGIIESGHQVRADNSLISPYAWLIVTLVTVAISRVALPYWRD